MKILITGADGFIGKNLCIALSKNYQTLTRRIQRYRYVGNLDETRWTKSVKEHDLIMMALRDRDALLLKQILTSHLDNGWQVAKRMTEGN